MTRHQHYRRALASGVALVVTLLITIAAGVADVVSDGQVPAYFAVWLIGVLALTVVSPYWGYHLAKTSRS